MSYWETRSSEVSNAVTDIVLPDGTGAGEVIATLRVPQTAFVPGAAYEFIVWRSPDAAEDTYSGDLWFKSVRVATPSETLEAIEGTGFSVYPVSP